MTCIPGSPQIQNLIPANYYGTTATAAPLMGLIGAAMIAIPGYIYLDWRIRCARKKGLHFVEDPKYKAEAYDESALPRLHWLSGLLPLVVVVLMLNVLPNVLKNAGIAELSSSEAIVVALLGGIVSVCLMNIFQFKKLLPAVNQGAEGSLTAIGLDPANLHRIASLASGGLDTLPHNGAVLTLLAVSNCTHKESYWDVCVTSCIIPVITSLLLSLVWGVIL